MSSVETMSDALASIYAVPVVLAAVGLGAALALTGDDFWPIALAWLVAAVIVVPIMRAARSRTVRALLALLLVIACPILTFEGGLFLLPSALALLAIEAIGLRHTPTNA